MKGTILDSTILIWSAGLVASGAAIGFLVGMTGVGAGSLTTPLLISVFQIPASVAVGTDLLFAALTKSTAAWRYQKHKYIDWPVLRLLATGSLPGALLMLAWLRWSHPSLELLSTLIGKALSVILLLSALANFAYPWLVNRDQPTGRADGPSQPRVAATIGLGLVMGAIVVLTSVGAGAIGVAALLVLYPNLSARRLIGTDVVHAIPLAFLAGLGHLALGSIDFKVLGLLLVGSVPGIAIGLRTANGAPEWLVRWALGAVLVLAAAILMLKSSH